MTAKDSDRKPAFPVPLSRYRALAPARRESVCRLALPRARFAAGREEPIEVELLADVAFNLIEEAINRPEGLP